jgi:hypothetical protein
VRVEVITHQYDEEDLELTLRFYNELGANIVIPVNQLAAVGPDGIAIYPDDDEVFVLKPQAQQDVEVKFESPNYDWVTIKGAFLRFDGVYFGEQRLNLPPISLGKPTHQPGEPRALAVPAQAKGKTKLTDAVVAAVDKVTGGNSSSTAAPAKPATAGLEEYKGPRRKIKTAGLKVAAMPLRAQDVSKDITFIMDELLLTELQTVGFEAIGPDDINAMVGFEGMKDQVGCDEASCAAEIGNALGVPYLIAGNVAHLEGSTVLTLKLINVKNTQVVARVSKIADGGNKVLPRVIAEAVQEMVTRSDI